MDAAALRKLEFTCIAEYTSRYCLSGMGRDHLLDAVSLSVPSELLDELERVLELRNFLLEGNPLPFSILPDTRPLLRQLEVIDSCLEPAGLQDVRHFLHASAELRKFMFGNREHYPKLNMFCIRLWLEKSIRHTISSVLDEQCGIRDTASDGLLLIRGELRESRIALQRKTDRLLRRCLENRWLMDDMVAMKNGRLTLGFKVEYKYKIPGYIQDYSGSGQTVFIEPAETLLLSNRIQELEIDERREIERILREVTAIIRPELENLRHNQQILAGFDAIYAKARLAVETASVLPCIDSGRKLRIVKGYHPWLLITHRVKHAEVFPLDLELLADEGVLVISGPNAGGKSVAMKTAGLLSAMLAHGYLLPCSESSVFPVFRSIAIEIGDDQSIENDLSTFSSHLAAIRDIIDAADGGSLVLIDELCSGTDVEEGGAIAKAVIEELLRKGAMTIVTTHLGELKAYGHERSGVVNGAMEFDREGLLPTFRFIKGVPGSSFAFAMMKRLGFSFRLVDEAERFMKNGHLGMERLLDDLKCLMQENRLQAASLEKERLLLASERETVTAMQADLAIRQRELKGRAMRDMQKEIEHARREIRSIVQDVKSSSGGEPEVADARRKLERRKKELQADEKNLEEKQSAAEAGRSIILAGDLVRFMESKATGEVESVQNGSAVVRCGNFRLTTSLRSLEKITKTGARKMLREPPTGTQSASWKGVSFDVESTTLDLRGMIGDEAIEALERFLDRISMNSIRQVTIIHGKGTGSLRRRTADCLQRHKAVERFRLGEWGEGGTGVTVVELKS
ncbi:MAG: Smr/MutS family protein [Chlorobium sp.]|uniref:endonuclease MutS2 n=1 Tax=Chlorobium sp. TaxID=1095 RepID=UPI0025BC49CF|nr:Smr/MutS family protein [Chlorobium sp.]MCF8216849.1 Smr/MutS family protein [Chlorobium sp.]MCF8271694.1 Smr/MutS family protein [Chlorobium sp.]MCF8288066.1 Smr/MutS family protein [Chlorobium sp.]MCF8291650.1 Smr/MutS family protein [Chlorobium sp.]MCF8385765.1 Smr/MutS family protein [Chlorobium sp.]